MTTPDVTIFVIVYLTFTGGGNSRRHEAQSFVGWLGRRELDASRSTTILLAVGAVASNEGNLSREIRGKGSEVSFDFVNKFVAGGVLELWFASVWMGILSVKILMVLKGVTPATNCDLLINCLAVSSSKN